MPHFGWPVSENVRLFPQCSAIHMKLIVQYSFTHTYLADDDALAQSAYGSIAWCLTACQHKWVNLCQYARKGKRLWWLKMANEKQYTLRFMTSASISKLICRWEPMFWRRLQATLLHSARFEVFGGRCHLPPSVIKTLDGGCLCC